MRYHGAPRTVATDPPPETSVAAPSPSSARVPMLMVVAVLLAVTATLLRACLHACGGQLVYPLDDTYIHMTMARNLALHGSWGIDPGAFQPASSSPLWTLLLAALTRVFGPHDGLPLALALACMVALATVLEVLLRDLVRPPLARAAVLLVLLVGAGLPGLAVTGMEPVLHLLLALPLAWMVVRDLARTEARPAASRTVIGALATLAVLTRFETLFLIAALAVAAWLRGRPGTAVALALGGGAALGGYAAIALGQGGPWLPSSVLINGPMVDSRPVDPLDPLLRRIPETFQRPRNEHITGLLLASAWLLLPRRRAVGAAASAARLMLVVTTVTVILHLQFALLDDFFRRYEAYLVLLGAFGVVAALSAGLGGWPDVVADRLPRVPEVAVAGLVAALIAGPLVYRGLQVVRWTPHAAQDIHQQQIQMAQFVRTWFRGRAVAINDLGAVSYYGGAHVVDLMGLATLPVARAMLEHRYDTGFIERLCAAESVEVALVYEPWFAGRTRLPGSWMPVARWTLKDNVITGGATVTVFGTDPATWTRVREAERRFAATLPRRVTVEELR